MRPKKSSFIFQNGALNKAVNVKACTQDVFLFGKFSLCRVLCDIFQHVFFLSHVQVSTPSDESWDEKQYFLLYKISFSLSKSSKIAQSEQS